MFPFQCFKYVSTKKLFANDLIMGAYFSVNVLSDYLESPALVRLWFSYMVPILTISHCGITSSSFLILAATFERYIFICCLLSRLRNLQKEMMRCY